LLGFIAILEEAGCFVRLRAGCGPNHDAAVSRCASGYPAMAAIDPQLRGEHWRGHERGDAVWASRDAGAGELNRQEGRRLEPGCVCSSRSNTSGLAVLPSGDRGAGFGRRTEPLVGSFASMAFHEPRRLIVGDSSSRSSCRRFFKRKPRCRAALYQRPPRRGLPSGSNGSTRAHISSSAAAFDPYAQTPAPTHGNPSDTPSSHIQLARIPSRG